MDNLFVRMPPAQAALASSSILLAAILLLSIQNHPKADIALFMLPTNVHSLFAFMLPKISSTELVWCTMLLLARKLHAALASILG